MDALWFATAVIVAVLDPLVILIGLIGGWLTLRRDQRFLVSSVVGLVASAIAAAMIVAAADAAQSRLDAGRQLVGFVARIGGVIAWAWVGWHLRRELDAERRALQDAIDAYEARKRAAEARRRARAVVIPHRPLPDDEPALPTAAGLVPAAAPPQDEAAERPPAALSKAGMAAERRLRPIIFCVLATVASIGLFAADYWLDTYQCRWSLGADVCGVLRIALLAPASGALFGCLVASEPLARRAATWLLREGDG